MNKKSLLPFLLDIAVLFIIAYYYNYHNNLSQRPQSIHAWRQADCASIALNYYQHGMHFFQPEVHNLNSDGGTTGYCATSEVPVVYYLTASLYFVFGYNELILRLINTFLYLLGLFYLFRLLYYLGRDLFWSISFSIIFFSSTVLVYYGNNFLTNVPAFSMAIAGWYYFFRFINEKKRNLLLITLLFFMIAGFLKVSAFMSLFAIAGYFLFEKVVVKKEKRVFNKYNWLFISGASITIILAGAWIVYAAKYNECHDCTYFSTTIFPIWDLSFQEIRSYITHIYHTWFNDYFHPTLHIFLIVLLVIIILKFRSVQLFNLTTLILLFVQSLLYISTQFWTFHDHDYYTIDLYILPVFIVITAYAHLFKNHPGLFKSGILKIIFIVFLIFNIYQTKEKVSNRYTGWFMDYYNEKSDIYSISEYLRKIGISNNDKVIFIPDGSNVALYLMNQQGWTQYTDARFNREAPIYYNRDSISILKSINRGAEYLIVNSLGDLYQFPYLQSYAHHLVGKYGSVLIFDLTDTTINFNCNKRLIKTTISCDAEKIDQEVFFTSIDTLFLQNASTQSNEKSFTGLKSVKLTTENPYGMTFITQNTRCDESFLIEVWRNGNAEAGIIASAPEFFLNKNSVESSDSTSDWEKITMEFFIAKQIENKELKIYLHNPSGKPAFFDDLKITWYHSPAENILESSIKKESQ